MTVARRVALYCAACDEYYFPDDDGDRLRLEELLATPSPDTTFEHSIGGEAHALVPAWRDLNS